jgi:hypothetical protein
MTLLDMKKIISKDYLIRECLNLETQEVLRIKRLRRYHIEHTNSI